MPKFKENKSAFMMKPKSPMVKALVGKQKNLPEELQAAIIASPSKMGHSPKKHMVDDMYASSNVSSHGWGKMKGSAHNAKHTDEEFRKKRTAELKAGAAASPKKKYKSAAQRKAVHASKAEAAMKMYGKKKK